MLRIFQLLLVVFIIELISQVHSYNQIKLDANYTEEYIKVPIDHFNFASSKTFLLRYLRNNSYVKNIENDPIFFYCGGEANVDKFANITGFMFEAAEQFKAEIIFAEHRYYGNSLPFGNNSVDNNENIGYLTTEQALADFAYLLDYLLNQNYNRPVIAFGGSYGGLLAAWLRIKYPHIVTGALASSAPMLAFDNMTPCNSYHEQIASVFESAYTKSCTSNIKRFYELLKSNDIDESFFENAFNFCNKDQTLKQFSYQLDSMYWNLAMGNYPYESNLIEPLPANPVREFCKYLNKEYEKNDLIEVMQKAINLYNNYTSDKNCLDLSSNNFIFNKQQKESWIFQRCTQLIIPICTSKNNKMFCERTISSFENIISTCQKYYKLAPRDHEIIIRYGGSGSNLNSASNIIFSNGMLDPWSPAGIFNTSNDKISIIIIPDGAHHFDLLGSHPKDPDSVKEARKQEISIISQWIKDFYITSNGH